MSKNKNEVLAVCDDVVEDNAAFNVGSVMLQDDVVVDNDIIMGDVPRGAIKDLVYEMLVTDASYEDIVVVVHMIYGKYYKMNSDGILVKACNTSVKSVASMKRDLVEMGVDVPSRRIGPKFKDKVERVVGPRVNVADAMELLRIKRGM